MIATEQSARPAASLSPTREFYGIIPVLDETRSWLNG